MIGKYQLNFLEQDLKEAFSKRDQKAQRRANYLCGSALLIIQSILALRLFLFDSSSFHIISVSLAISIIALLVNQPHFLRVSTALIFLQFILLHVQFTSTQHQNFLEEFVDRKSEIFLIGLGYGNLSNIVLQCFCKWWVRCAALWSTFLLGFVWIATSESSGTIYQLLESLIPLCVAAIFSIATFYWQEKQDHDNYKLLFLQNKSLIDWQKIIKDNIPQAMVFVTKAKKLNKDGSTSACSSATVPIERSSTDTARNLVCETNQNGVEAAATTTTGTAADRGESQEGLVFNFVNKRFFDQFRIKEWVDKQRKTIEGNRGYRSKLSLTEMISKGDALKDNLTCSESPLHQILFNAIFKNIFLAKPNADPLEDEQKINGQKEVKEKSSESDNSSISDSSNSSSSNSIGSNKSKSSSNRSQKIKESERNNNNNLEHSRKSTMTSLSEYLKQQMDASNKQNVVASIQQPRQTMSVRSLPISQTEDHSQCQQQQHQCLQQLKEQSEEVKTLSCFYKPVSPSFVLEEILAADNLRIKQEQQFQKSPNKSSLSNKGGKSKGTVGTPTSATIRRGIPSNNIQGVSAVSGSAVTRNLSNIAVGSGNGASGGGGTFAVLHTETENLVYQQQENDQLSPMARQVSLERRILPGGCVRPVVGSIEGASPVNRLQMEQQQYEVKLLTNQLVSPRVLDGGSAVVSGGLSPVHASNRVKESNQQGDLMNISLEKGKQKKGLVVMSAAKSPPSSSGGGENGTTAAVTPADIFMGASKEAGVMLSNRNQHILIELDDDEDESAQNTNNAAIDLEKVKLGFTEALKKSFAKADSPNKMQEVRLVSGSPKCQQGLGGFSVIAPATAMTTSNELSKVVTGNFLKRFSTQSEKVGDIYKPSAFRAEKEAMKSKKIEGNLQGAEHLHHHNPVDGGSFRGKPEEDFYNLDSNSGEMMFFDTQMVSCVWGDEEGVLLIMNDVSLQIINEKLREIERFKDKMLSTVTHDLKTPLNSIIMILENSIELGELNSKQQRIILQNSHLLMSLINDILDYSQIQRDKFRLMIEEIDISQCVLDVVDLFEIQAEQKRIRLQAEFKNLQQKIIMQDERRIKQILVNLIGNAMKFTQRDGQIHVVVKQKEPHCISIAIKDTGTGISKDIQKKLFQFFNTFDHSERANNRHGIGLGLAICKQLNSQLGPWREIQLKSQLNKGSKFTFCLYVNLLNHQDGMTAAQREVGEPLISHILTHHSAQNIPAAAAAGFTSDKYLGIADQEFEGDVLNMLSLEKKGSLQRQAATTGLMEIAATNQKRMNILRSATVTDPRNNHKHRIDQSQSNYQQAGQHHTNNNSNNQQQLHSYNYQTSNSSNQYYQQSHLVPQTTKQYHTMNSSMSNNNNNNNQQPNSAEEQRKNSGNKNTGLSVRQQNYIMSNAQTTAASENMAGQSHAFSRRNLYGFKTMATKLTTKLSTPSPSNRSSCLKDANGDHIRSAQQGAALVDLFSAAAAAAASSSSSKEKKNSQYINSNNNNNNHLQSPQQIFMKHRNSVLIGQQSSMVKIGSHVMNSNNNNNNNGGAPSGASSHRGNNLSNPGFFNFQDSTSMHSQSLKRDPIKDFVVVRGHSEMRGMRTKKDSRAMTTVRTQHPKKIIEPAMRIPKSNRSTFLIKANTQEINTHGQQYQQQMHQQSQQQQQNHQPSYCRKEEKNNSIVLFQQCSPSIIPSSNTYLSWQEIKGEQQQNSKEQVSNLIVSKQPKAKSSLVLQTMNSYVVTSMNSISQSALHQQQKQHSLTQQNQAKLQVLSLGEQGNFSEQEIEQNQLANPSTPMSATAIPTAPNMSTPGYFQSHFNKTNDMFVPIDPKSMMVFHSASRQKDQVGYHKDLASSAFISENFNEIEEFNLRCQQSGSVDELQGQQQQQQQQHQPFNQMFTTDPIQSETDEDCSIPRAEKSRGYLQGEAGEAHLAATPQVVVNVLSNESNSPLGSSDTRKPNSSGETANNTNRMTQIGISQQPSLYQVSGSPDQTNQEPVTVDVIGSRDRASMDRRVQLNMLMNLLGDYERVMIADDSPFNIFCLEQILCKNESLIITQAFDGKEALDSYKKHRQQIIFMDLNMPILDGYECMRSIRDYEAANQIEDPTKVIIVSAQEFEPFFCNFDGFISKPIKLADIINTLHAFRESKLELQQMQQQQQFQ